MLITNVINQKIAEALKAHDEIKLSTLRLLSSSLNYEFIAKQHKLSQEEEIVVVKKEAKKRKEAIEALRQAQGKLTTSSEADMKLRLEKEAKELNILKGFLPLEMSDGELEKIVDATIAETRVNSLSDMGRVIGAVKAKVKGQAEGGKIAFLVKEKLSGK